MHSRTASSLFGAGDTQPRTQPEMASLKPPVSRTSNGQSALAGNSGPGTPVAGAETAWYGCVSKQVIDKLVREYQMLAHDNQDMAVATVAIKTLTSLIQISQATTMMGLEKEIKEAALALQRCNPSSMSLKAGCELFLRYTTRTSAIENEDFSVAKARLIERGEQFAKTSELARQDIAEVGARFLMDGQTVLVHGHSRVVIAILQHAAARGCHFNVLVTEGRPVDSGIKTAKALSASGIPVTLIMDSGCAFHMARVSMVLVGAEAVVESGGVINSLGTYQIALCAQAHNKPMYVAAESYKFARLFPLNQHDLPREEMPVSDILPLLPRHVTIDNPSRDYTPPSQISLLITDFGVLTPAAVSDELIQLYI